jgi:hypothetical protein
MSIMETMNIWNQILVFEFSNRYEIGLYKKIVFNKRYKKVLNG